MLHCTSLADNLLASASFRCVRSAPLSCGMVETFFRSVGVVPWLLWRFAKGNSTTAILRSTMLA